ncbi:hypothetical protein niasHS_007511 [Heterodera schachtii]|uniref:Uncharacterized protein n=1 Tax=Heterodera schachtii TaxID=97005 RepID=A0ABD2JXS6_HETSC
MATDGGIMEERERMALPGAGIDRRRRATDSRPERVDKLGIDRAEDVGANAGQIARRLETICAMAFWRAMKSHLFGRGPIGGGRNGAGGEKTKTVAKWDNEGEKGAVTLFPFRVRVIGLSSAQVPSVGRPLRLFFSASLNGQMVPAKSLFADLSLLSLSEMSALLRIPIIGISALVQIEMTERAQWWVIALIAGGGILLIGCGWMLLVLYFNLCTVPTIQPERMEEEKKEEKKEGNEERSRETGGSEEEKQGSEKGDEKERGGKERGEKERGGKERGEKEREKTEREQDSLQKKRQQHMNGVRENDQQQQQQQQKATTARSKSWRRRAKKTTKLRRMVGVLGRKNGRGGRRKNEVEKDEDEGGGKEEGEEEGRTTEVGGREATAEEEGEEPGWNHTWKGIGGGRGGDHSAPKMGRQQRQKVEESAEERPIVVQGIGTCPKLAIPSDALIAQNGRRAAPNRLRPYWVADQLESIYHLFQSPSTHPRPGPKAKGGEIRAEIVEE